MAITHSQIVVEALKLADDNDGQGRFWKGKRGFPSGHAISSWAFASVVAKEYNDNRLIQVGAYSLATIAHESLPGDISLPTWSLAAPWVS